MIGSVQAIRRMEKLSTIFKMGYCFMSRRPNEVLSDDYWGVEVDPIDNKSTSVQFPKYSDWGNYVSYEANGVDWCDGNSAVSCSWS
jgi:hypothetical protein